MGRRAARAPRSIRRYPNRKLYDPARRRYVTLEDLAGLVAGGEELEVLDQRSGEDITNLVLAQVLLEGVREKAAAIPRQVLLRLVRYSAGTQEASSRRPAEPDLKTRAKDEAERIVAGLLRRGRLSLEEALSLRQEIAGSVTRMAAEAQRGLEQAFHGVLTHADGEGRVAPSLEGLKEKLLTLETYLKPRRKPGAPPREGPRTRRGKR